MSNPFNFFSVVTGKDFCDRKEEISDLVGHIGNSANIVLISKRRYGKTSLIREILQNRLAEDIVGVYVDLFGISNELDFIRALSKGIAQSGIKKPLPVLLKELRSIFSRITFSASLDEEGTPSIKPELGSRDFDTLLDDVLDGFQRSLSSRGGRGCIVMDEFQKVTEIGYDALEAKLRGKVQLHTNISYVFSGSKRHILAKMFSDTSRPFYALSSMMELQEIQEDVFFEFCRERFSHKGMELTQEGFAFLYQAVMGETKFIQKACYYLFESGETQITAREVSAVIKDINLRNDSLFRMILDTFTRNQQLVLRILADRSKKLFSKAVVMEYGISPQSVKTTLEALVKKEMVIKEKDGYFLHDAEFAAWLRERGGAL